MSVFKIIQEYQEGFIKGIGVTFQLCLIIWLSGFFIGGLLGVLGSKYKLGIGIPSKILSFVLSGIPILVFLFWLHYPAQELLQIQIDPFITASVTLSIVNIFAVADIVRNAMENLPNQYIEVAKVCGIPITRRLWKIDIPLIFRHAISPFIIVQVNMLHMTLFASLISVDEIFRVTQRVNAIIYKPVEIYTALGIFFLMISLPLNGLALWLKNKYARDISER
ncbi:ABC-type transporter, integral membrane subunit [Caldithrix abyssi DSM 13497]|uniref:ABC-type transporter, integral membrane subunit n=1 Tax=Caldithrix abyssi DSM 13497 TaxID=880073 RepID=H1XVT5_CALAY|nr:ABC transporter permease subunit [Caldithrix abyssi]APF20871.1 Binding-protein-dependent transport system inner membrane component [Caldithrix abyssi DSM 13497]EHO40662.1 ABC-type transporter, integral membrane subunit [Caldithrix abyssi DSM 13497]